MKPLAPCLAWGEHSRRQDPSGLFLPSPLPSRPASLLHPRLPPFRPPGLLPSNSICDSFRPHFGALPPVGPQRGCPCHACALPNSLTQPFHHTRSASPQPGSLVTSRLLHAHPQAAEEIHSCANWHQDRFRAAYPPGGPGASQQHSPAPCLPLSHLRCARP